MSNQNRLFTFRLILCKQFIYVVTHGFTNIGNITLSHSKSITPEKKSTHQSDFIIIYST